MQPRIFVSIASYRDTECQWTVKDLFEKATHPERVFVGICWQFVQEEDDDCFLVKTRPEQCRVIEIDARQSRGVCWARAKVQQLWQGEEFYFQIDAHSRFAPGWDETMLSMWAACETPRAVLSSYPASYEPPDRLGPDVVATIHAKEFDERGLLSQGSRSVPQADAPAKPAPTAFIGAGLLFGPSALIREVPYDPFIYFTGEEITLAARLWTHCWDLFSPNRVTVYHEYTPRANKKRHWQDHKLWTELSGRAVKRVRHLLDREPCDDAQALQDIDQYGLGSQRSLADYQAFSGVDFKRKLIGGRSQAELEAALPEEARRARVRERFTEIWRNNAWGSRETRSGPGSTLEQTTQVRVALAQVMSDLGIRRLVDAGCGDMNWMQQISVDLELYLGFDVVAEAVEELRRKFVSRKNHFFNTADICVDVLPRADAILCRDVLGHLSAPMVLQALSCFKRSGARYFIATTFDRGSNPPTRVGAWIPIDLCAAPFNLPPPLLRVEETAGKSGKSLGVWAMNRWPEALGEG